MTRIIPFAIVTLFSVILPLLLLIWWKRKTGAKIWSFLVGAIIFVVFAVFIESFINKYCMLVNKSLAAYINESAMHLAVYGGLLAGVCEETGRLVGFKLLLRRHREKDCAIAYGIGHGGTEIILVLGVTYGIYLLALMGINIGGDTSVAQLISTASQIPIATMAVAMVERLSAIMLQIGLSMLVFVGCKQRGKLWYYLVAIVLHALVDIFAVLYQQGIFGSLLLLEALVLVYGIVIMMIGGSALAKYKPGKKKSKLEIKKIDRTRFGSALELVWSVFSEFEAPNYTEDGRKLFYDSIHMDDFLDSIDMTGAYVGGKLVGVIATRENHSHIALLFVEGKYHGKGIGRRLFETVMEEDTKKTMTVNSSIFAHDVYKRLGFEDLSELKEEDGIKYIPMVYRKPNPVEEKE